MDRKKFLSTVLPAVPAFALEQKNKIASGFEKLVLPPFLKKGDLIAITCPSGFIPMEEIQAAICKMEEWGFRIKVGRTVGARDFTFAGTDTERAADLQRMLDDQRIKAIMLGRGGYGAVRIIDMVNFSSLSRHPKWIIGFSDATVLHAHLQKNFSVASIHSKMCNSFPDDWLLAEQTQRDSIDSIRQCLEGQSVEYPVTPNIKNKAGKGRGVLVGGNLSILENLAGTDSDLDTDGKI